MHDRNIVIRQATLQDASAISCIHYKALERFHEFYALFLATHPQELIPIMTKKALGDAKNIFLVAVDQVADSVVGFIRYGKISESAGGETDTTISMKAQDQTQPSVDQLLGPKKHLRALYDEFSHRGDEMDALYQRKANRQTHYFIKHLMVDPSQQRRGIGRELLATVLTRADAEHLPVFLVSSSEAHSLYVSMGFVDYSPAFRIGNEQWARRVKALEAAAEVEDIVIKIATEKFRGLWEEEHCMVREVL